MTRGLPTWRTMQRLRTLLASNLAGEAGSEQSAPISARVIAEDEDLVEIDPLDLFCSSIDTLLSRSIDQTIEPGGGWSSRPTRLSGVGDGRGEIQQMCRRGIPPSLRCAAWIINVVAAVNPEWSKSECDEFGTFRKVRVIDHGWELVLKSLFPDETDLQDANVLDMGIGDDQLMNLLLHDHGGSPIPDKGIQSLTKVLHAARDSLGLEFCPLLPDVTCLLLSFMPESYAYATIRQVNFNPNGMQTLFILLTAVAITPSPDGSGRHEPLPCDIENQPSVVLQNIQ